MGVICGVDPTGTKDLDCWNEALTGPEAAAKINSISI